MQKKNTRMKVPAKQSLVMYELKQHKIWFLEEYLQLLVQTKQVKINLVAGSQLKQYG
jgi:hypothetical protein